MPKVEAKCCSQFLMDLKDLDFLTVAVEHGDTTKQDFGILLL